MAIADNKGASVTALESKHWYEYGSLDVFTRLLKDYTGLPDPKVYCF